MTGNAALHAAVALFARNRIGYMIDTALVGLAIGSGFAMAENALFLAQFAQVGIGTWLVRGFGTALMHGGATAIMASLSYLLFAPRLHALERQLGPALVRAVQQHLSVSRDDLWKLHELEIDTRRRIAQ